jgi:uncharacterized damage-inducible protein DinB
MKELFVTFAQFSEEANKAVTGILGKMTNEDREKSRKSYYGSFSGLYCHLLGGTVFFLGMIKDAVPGNAAAQKALKPLEKIERVKGKLTEEQWEKAAAAMKAADKACLAFVSALSEEDLKAPVKLNWYNGKPPAVPLYFMLQQLVAHGTHHRGQIPQILDSLKIDNDFSGISVKFLPRRD